MYAYLWATDPVTITGFRCSAISLQEEEKVGIFRTCSLFPAVREHPGVPTCSFFLPDALFAQPVRAELDRDHVSLLTS